MLKEWRGRKKGITRREEEEVLFREKEVESQWRTRMRLRNRNREEKKGETEDV
jgi:hypothetical protein